MAYKYSRRGGHGGRRPGAGRKRKAEPEADPFLAFLEWRSPLDDYIDSLPPIVTPAGKKAGMRELNRTIRALGKFGWDTSEWDKMLAEEREENDG